MKRVALTIAGSDSGGGAGIQADLKTFQALGVFGTSAIACVTAQNPDAVAGIQLIEPRLVALQIRAVCDGFPVCAAKTGMLVSSAIIRAVARAVKRCRIPLLVVDPVMISTSGARLLREEAVRTLCRELLPQASVITPNLPEAEVLCGHTIRTPAEVRSAVRELAEIFGTACLLKGGHLPGAAVTDVLVWRGRSYEFQAPRIRAHETHGTGCMFSAALTAFLALDLPLPVAAKKAQAFVISALARAVKIGRHWPLNPGKGVP